MPPSVRKAQVKTPTGRSDQPKRRKSGNSAVSISIRTEDATERDSISDGPATYDDAFSPEVGLADRDDGGDEWVDEPPADVVSTNIFVDRSMPPSESRVESSFAENGLIPREDFDDAGYLRLNPDVRTAIESGIIDSGYSHYVIYGRSEGRPLPDMPHERRNVMLISAQDLTGAAEAPKEARGSVDAVLIAPNGGMMVVGWVDDMSHPLSVVRIIGTNWRVAIDAARFLRVRRTDVENAIGVRRPHAFGFIGFIQFSEGGDGAGPLRVELWQVGGASTVLQASPSFVEELELRDIMLTHLASATFFGSPVSESMNYLGRGLGAELVRFNRTVSSRMVARPYIERFGPQDRPCRGSIIVCLYGKAEFFFLQNCIFSGLPGIEDYEFIYVSNSPELAETLVREAKSATLTYGLSNTVVVLPGNAGFGAANNAAARVARSARLLIVNPDIFPRDRDWAKKHTDLIETAPSEQTRIFGLPLYYDDGSLMHGGMYFEVDVGLSITAGLTSQERICRVTHYGKGAPPNTIQYTEARPVPAVSGAFISIERSWFETLGGFTEDFIFGHYEDADLCLKSLQRGSPSWLHDIRLWHLEGKGSTRKPPHEGGSIVNRWIFSRTWMSTLDSGLVGPTPAHPMLQISGASASRMVNAEPANRPSARRRKAV